ncbi:hypothetical protein NKG94_20080 [Micromonospora sp. M12]
MPLLNLLLVPAAVAAAVQHDPTPFFAAAAVAVVATGVVGAIIALTWLRGRGAGQARCCRPSNGGWTPTGRRWRSTSPARPRTSTRRTCGSRRPRRSSSARWC